jgi:hypothetical protein
MLRRRAAVQTRQEPEALPILQAVSKLWEGSKLRALFVLAAAGGLILPAAGE